MSATAFHTPPPYVIPPISMIAVTAELSDLRNTKRDDRLWAIHGTPKARIKAMARLARLAELEGEL